MDKIHKSRTTIWYVHSHKNPLPKHIHETILLLLPFYDLGLVGEAKVNAKGRVHETLEGLGSGETVRVLGDGGHVLGIQLHQVTVILDTRGGDRLGENGGTTGDCRY